MAGHRRATGKPMRRVLRSQRREQTFAEKLADETSPRGRAAIVIDHLRSDIPAGQPTDEAVFAVVEEILRVADEIRVMAEREKVAGPFSEAGEARDHLAIASDYLRNAIGRNPSRAVLARLNRLLIQLTDDQKGDRR